MIITDRETPFGIVIVEKLRCGTGPAATQFPVGSRYRRAHMPIFPRSLSPLGFPNFFQKPLGRKTAQSSTKFSRASAFDGVISRMSAFTTFSATNGSVFTLLCSSDSDVLCATIPPPKLGCRLPANKNTPSSKPRWIHSLWPSMNWLALPWLSENLRSTINIGFVLLLRKVLMVAPDGNRQRPDRRSGPASVVSACMG